MLMAPGSISGTFLCKDRLQGRPPKAALSRPTVGWSMAKRQLLTVNCRQSPAELCQ